MLYTLVCKELTGQSVDRVVTGHTRTRTDEAVDGGGVGARGSVVAHARENRVAHVQHGLTHAQRVLSPRQLKRLGLGRAMQRVRGVSRSVHLILMH